MYEDLRYFKIKEFDCKDPNIIGEGTGLRCMNPDFVYKCDELRHRCGFPLKVNSGYRTPEYNNKVSYTGFNGAHTTGRAADFAIGNSFERDIILKHAFILGFTGKGLYTNFIHLDDLESLDRVRPVTWLYS